MTSGNSCVVEMQASGDVDALGNPLGFFSTPLAQHIPSYPLLVTTQMSRDRSVDQLILMSDGRYLSSTTSSMTLRLVSYNADAQSLAFVRFPFEWQDAGVIVGGPPYILALPVLAYSSYGSSRSVTPAQHDLAAAILHLYQIRAQHWMALMGQLNFPDMILLQQPCVWARSRPCIGWLLVAVFPMPYMPCVYVCGSGKMQSVIVWEAAAELSCVLPMLLVASTDSVQHSLLCQPLERMLYCRWKGIFPDALVFFVMVVFATNVALRVRQITHKHNRHLWRLLYEKTGLLLDVFIVALQASSKESPATNYL